MEGQVLEHLTTHAAPTRSEVCHLFDLVFRGYAGVVLSDETAVGHDPVAATATAARLLRAGLDRPVGNVRTLGPRSRRARLPGTHGRLAALVRVARQV